MPFEFEDLGGKDGKKEEKKGGRAGGKDRGGNKTYVSLYAWQEWWAHGVL